MKPVVLSLSHMLYGGFVNLSYKHWLNNPNCTFPLNKIGSINKINKMYAYLEQAHERPPSAEEIAKELGHDINDVKES